ncbi:hypothetical protein N5W20_06905 [Candidatus Kirkpatrickella diaphorinae]|uniref:Uncharacterized protein n=1 Tax=Candidatus Kirkpatrickella diaphorinae TaxID=2984322 RepID=A0ABY6GHU4_9PROT|nr:hypothetical protein [Candidatus Kirkpatrickella diaphorinae]UYH50834.1 hypothetical protein N5W20_06905 [Candidatus Kirkpatrickella diaphorinae]
MTSDSRCRPIAPPCRRILCASGRKNGHSIVFSAEEGMMKQHISAPKKRKRPGVTEKKPSSATPKILDENASPTSGRVTNKPLKKPTPRKISVKSCAQAAATPQRTDRTALKAASPQRRSGRMKNRVETLKADDDPVAFEALARRYASEALCQLAEIARACDSDATRVSAIREILNRALGRSAPRRPIEKDAPEAVPILKIVPYINGTRD